MCQRPPISTPTATLFPCTPLFLSSRPRLAVRGRRCLRQLDHEAGAATLAILVPEVATGIGDNLFGQRQAEAAGNPVLGLLQAGERLEQLALQRLGDAGAESGRASCRERVC